MVLTDPVGYYFPPRMWLQNRGMWSRRNFVCSERRPKAFDMSAGIPNLPVTQWSVANIHNRVLCCKSISINYEMHGWFLCWQHATGWFWWICGLRTVAMWSSSSLTKVEGQSSACLCWKFYPMCNVRVVIFSRILRDSSLRCEFSDSRS